MIFAFSIFLLALINDIFVANDVYRFIYTAEYAFMFIVLSNANLMIGRFIDLQNEMEDINKKLETRIAERTKELEAANAALKEASLCDSLTGLRNRRYIQEYVVDYVNKFLKSKLLTSEKMPDQRNNSTNDAVIGIMMLDIDHFKKTNDKYGHAAGDHALKQLSIRMKDSFRSDDIVIRWGGEEFLVILNKIDPRYMPNLTKKMLRIFRETKVVFDEKTEGVLTCSIGSTTFPISDRFPDLISFNDCINCCDQALYLSKQGGRNRATYVEVDEAFLAEHSARYSIPNFRLDVSGLDDPLFLKTVIE
jgi:diguanylate cyclase (GGDEF)-like protein